MPFGCLSDVEFSRIRVESTVLAPSDDDLAEHLLLGAGPAIEVLHALREALVVDEDARGDRVRSDLEPARSRARTGSR